MKIPNRQHMVLVVGYLLSAVSFAIFVSSTENEYAWMLEEEPYVKLPVDVNADVKAIIFGIPMLTLIGFVVVYSLCRFGMKARLISVLFALALLLSASLAFLRSHVWRVL